MKQPITPEELHRSHRWFKLDELRQLPGNPNTGDEQSLTDSIDQFGWFDGIVVADGIVLAGNHRLQRALDRGEAGLPGYDLTGFDVSDAERMSMAITHNRTTRAGVDDPELLRAALETVAVDDRQLAVVAVGPELADDMLGPAVVPDFAPLPPESQPRLDRREPVVCPSCSHSFLP
jgi:hypothetical protein